MILKGHSPYCIGIAIELTCQIFITWQVFFLLSLFVIIVLGIGGFFCNQ